MADTKLKLSVDAGKDVLYVFDKTGAYSSQNTAGWGLPNDLISDVSTAVVRVFQPLSDTYLTVNVFPSLPNSTNVGFEIIPSDLGLTSFLPGIYKFQYYIVFSSGKIASQTKYFFYHTPLSCCIGSKKSKLSLSDASSKESLEVLELETLLENAIWASCSGDIATTQEISDYILTKCSCCC